GVSHVRLRGITFRYAANFAQRGAFAMRRFGDPAAEPPRGWVVEDCVFERANASAASLTGEGHVFRRCVFQENGQLGFGASRCHRTRMEQCGIYRNNTKGYSTGWEAGGLKVTLSRGFVFDRCRCVGNLGVGIWYDIGNEQAEVKHCYIAHNHEAGIFYEISYSLHAHDNLIVNNANESENLGGAWSAAGITLSSSEECVVEYNTLVGNRDGITFREQNRDTPRIDGPRSVRVFNRNHLIRNNVVAHSQAWNIGFWMDTNFFGPHPGGGDANRPLFEDPKTLNIRLQNNLLYPLPGRPNYLYGCPWRPKSRVLENPVAFTEASGIADTSRVAEPRFVDVLAGDFRLQADSPALPMGAGVRNLEAVPLVRNGGDLAP
ncbi:MAG: right-handed parallel beta-helix repeat-containing protein, partial [Armatimonadota bacterium]|nr:right-handed parallel beta-helix repeat-containing protein [Armatimonadota bacterium]